MIQKRFNGMEIFWISSLNLERIEDLKGKLEKGKTYSLIGQSGIGKSTLLNLLLEESIQKTKKVRKGDKKGKHTTTYRSIFSTPILALIVDTPVMKELGIEEVGFPANGHFSTIHDSSRQCQYSNCNHKGMKVCSIEAALENGDLDCDGYLNYKKVIKEEHHEK